MTCLLKILLLKSSNSDTNKGFTRVAERTNLRIPQIRLKSRFTILSITCYAITSNPRIKKYSRLMRNLTTKYICVCIRIYIYNQISYFY